MNIKAITPTLTACLTLALASAAHAQVAAPVTVGTATATNPGPTAAATPVATTPVATTPVATGAPESQKPQTPWIKRYRPVARSWELGIYAGAFIPSARHEFYEPDLDIPGLGHQKLARAGFDVGLRAGYYPLSFIGVELEGGVIPTRAADGKPATVYTFRPVVLAQLPYRIAPFVRAGFGLVGISADTLGKDIDPSFNIGAGVKFYVNRRIALRLEVVDNVATSFGIGNDRSNNMEVLLGLSLRLGKRPPAPTPAPAPLLDSDGDGLYDPGQATPPDTVDACPQQPGPRETRGCPLVDTDRDTLYDPGQPVAATEIDACPLEPGPRPLQGCPDRDGDTFIDTFDKCPDVAGVAPDGCPPADRDKDMILDRDDRCPVDPETRNSYQDEDGCPDAVPQAVARFTGVIKGIFFDVDKDTIKPSSYVTLRNAVKVLGDFPAVKVEISGHTDSDGSREHNTDLSRRRAESVKQFLVDAGIDPGRLTTRGAGPDQPIAENRTARGKAQNRRIEFKLIH